MSHLQPAIQRHFDQLIPCRQSLHSHHHHQQQQQQQHHSADVTVFKCCDRHLLTSADTSTIVKLADSRHRHDCDLNDDDDDCVSPTWRRRSDVDITNVGRTFDVVNECQPPPSSSSSSSSQSPSSNVRQQISSSSSSASAQNVLVSNVSLTNEDSHMLLTRS